MFVSDEEVTALRAEVERAKKDLARMRREEKEYERLRRKRSWGTSFDRQGGDNSADRRGTAVPTMGFMWTRGVSTAADLEQSLTYVSRGIVPKLPVECSPSEYIAWEQRFEFFIANQGLRHTISLDAPEIAVISCTNNAYIFGQFSEELVLEHRQVWGYISDAAVDAPFEISLYKRHSILDALRMMREWLLPLHPAERHLLVAELERVQFMGDEESEIVQFILRQFPERPSHPHALVVGRGFRDGGAVGGGSMPRQQQQLQHWFHDGGIPRQQQQQQQWSRGGGNPHQHQRSLHTVPPDRPARQQPSRGIHTSGGDGEHGRNPLSAPATEAVPDTSVFPAASSKAVAEAPTSSAGAASTQYLQQRRRPVVLFSPLHRWGARPGRPLLQMKQRHRRRHRRPAVLSPRLHHLGGQSGRASRLLERRHRTLYRRRHRRPAVLFPRLHHLGGQSGRASRLLEWRHRTLYRRRHRQPAVMLPRLHHLGRQSVRVSRLLERHHRTWQRRRFHWRSATTSTAVTAEATAAAAAATTPPAITTHGGKQPMLEHCCDPSILGKDANGMRG